jgi:probable rRNA maturation factor
VGSRIVDDDEVPPIWLPPTCGGDRGGGNEPYLPGDIVISLDALRENAGFFKVSEDEELRRLIIHGILHLAGNDHASNDPGEPMLVKQENILETIGERIF